jgi:nucleotide-binding universal stress UspA family protein
MLPVKLILCPSDFSDPSNVALKVAVELASHFDAQLCLMHVVPSVPPLPADPNYAFFGVEQYEQALQEDAEQRLKDTAQQRIPKGVKCRAIFKRGDAANEIVLGATEEGADLIVIATHGRTGWRHLVFGSVAERVVRFAECPVLTIRAPKP